MTDSAGAAPVGARAPQQQDEQKGDTHVDSLTQSAVGATGGQNELASTTLPYERIDDDALLKALHLFDGERLLVLQPYGWHIDAKHIPNAAEHFSREGVCEDHGWEVVCDYGPYIAIVRAKSQ